MNTQQTYLKSQDPLPESLDFPVELPADFGEVRKMIRMNK